MEIESAVKNFGGYLRKLRKEVGLNQPEMASELQINYRYYQDLEGGKRKIKLDTFLKILKYFEVSAGSMTQPFENSSVGTKVFIDLENECSKRESISEELISKCENHDSYKMPLILLNKEGKIVWGSEGTDKIATYGFLKGKEDIYFWDLLEDEKKSTFMKRNWDIQNSETLLMSFLETVLKTRQRLSVRPRVKILKNKEKRSLGVLLSYQYEL